MLLCWSVKGGSGTSVVAAGLALALAGRGDGALLVDLGGDQPAILGRSESDGVGVRDWLVDGDAAPPDALGRLELDVVPGLRLLPAGDGRGGRTAPGVAGRAALLAALLDADRRAVVVDAGPAGFAGHQPGEVVLDALRARHHRSLLVLQPCYLALRRASRLQVGVDGVVLVAEAWRALSAEDIAGVVDAPVVAEVPVEPAVSRAVDAGTLATRPPRALVRALRPVVS
jgi:MinD-like ATPase involved in chromosome partitioning or flagellar assembly